MSATNQQTENTNREVVITCTFDAPRTLVWEAWTDPRHITQWWGPKGFSSSSCEMDLRVGGIFRLNLLGPDGALYPCKGVCREIKAPERIVYAGEAEACHSCGAGLPPRSLVTVTFAEHNGMTTLTIHTVFESGSDREAAIQVGYSKGWVECLERLATTLS